jgi:hypothetical protein
MMEWLEPSIEKRSWEVVEICESENEELYEKFSRNIKILKKE